MLSAGEPTVYVTAGVTAYLTQDETDLASRLRRNTAAAGVDDPEALLEFQIELFRGRKRRLPVESITVEMQGGVRFTAGGREFKPIPARGHNRFQMALRTGDVLFAGDALIEPFRAVAGYVRLDDSCCRSFAAYRADWTTSRRSHRRSTARIPGTARCLRTSPGSSTETGGPWMIDSRRSKPSWRTGRQ